MTYQKQNFKRGQILTAEQMNKIDEGLNEMCLETEKNKTQIEESQKSLGGLSFCINQTDKGVDIIYKDTGGD